MTRADACAEALQILGLLIEDWPTARIAAELNIDTQNLATHVEQTLAKLAAPNRTVAATRAIRHGRYVPCCLAGIRDK